MRQWFFLLLLSLLSCVPLYEPAIEGTTTRATQQRVDPDAIPTRSSWNPRTEVLTETITPLSVQVPSDAPPRIPISRITTYTWGDRWRARQELDATVEYTNPFVEMLGLHVRLIPRPRFSQTLRVLDLFDILQPSAHPVTTIPIPVGYSRLCIALFVGNFPEWMLRASPVQLNLPNNVHHILIPEVRVERNGDRADRIITNCFNF